ncbi:hypothetical protein LCGC14_2976450, partial [marine sediment metagenome]
MIAVPAVPVRTFELLNESLYSWEITSNGDLNVSSL